MTAFDGKGSFRELLLADPRIAAVLAAGRARPASRSGGVYRARRPFVDRVVREARRLNR